VISMTNDRLQLLDHAIEPGNRNRAVRMVRNIEHSYHGRANIGNLFDVYDRRRWMTACSVTPAPKEN
jgi:hypothetical protein